MGALGPILGGVSGLLGNVFGFINSGRAANNIATQANNAVNATANATKAAVGGINTGLEGITQAQQNAVADIHASGDRATQAVQGATGGANDFLQNLLGQSLQNTQNLTNPYIQGGNQGLNALAAYQASNPQFNFNPGDISKSPGYQAILQGGQDAITNQAAARGLSQSGAALKDLTSFGQNLAGTQYQNLFNQAQSQFQTNQAATLNSILPLISSGQFGAGQNLASTFGAQNAFGAPQAQNTLQSGYFAGNTQNQMAQFLASLGLQGAQSQLQGQEYAGNLGLQGNIQAGNFALQGGLAQAGGKQAQGSFLSNGLSNLGGLLTQIIPGLGAGGSNLAVSPYPGAGSYGLAGNTPWT